MSPTHPSPEESFASQKQEHDHPDGTHEDDFDLILLGPMEERPGSTLGNVRIRVTLPRHRAFHHIKEGVLEATEAAEVPSGLLARTMHWLKRALIGVPMASMQEEGERLSKFKALAILSSDAISSVAFATEAILINLVAAGSLYLGLTLPSRYPSLSSCARLPRAVRR